MCYKPYQLQLIIKKNKNDENKLRLILEDGSMKTGSSVKEILTEYITELRNKQTEHLTSTIKNLLILGATPDYISKITSLLVGAPVL